MANRRYLKFTVAEDDKKIVRKFLVQKKFSSSQLHNLRNKGGLIYVNHKHRHFNYQLKTGDEIVIVMSREIPSDVIEPMAGEIKVVFEDKYLLVVDKPPNMASLPAKAKTSRTMANIVKYYLQQKGENGTIHLVTRLDRDTSGLMVFAKNSYAHSLLDQILHSENFQKYYLAIVYGHLSPRSGKIDLPIGIDDQAFYLRKIDHQNGKESQTLYGTLEEYPNASLVKLKLLTGRTHQIRVHMQASGHPLFGDFMYSKKQAKEIDRQALHCAELKIVHPVTGEMLDLFAPLPEDMTKLSQLLRG